MALKINSDLLEAREKVNFSIEEFTNWYHGGADKVKEKRLLESYFISDPALTSDVDPSYLSHKEKYEDAIRRLTMVLKRIEKFQSEGHNVQDLRLKLLGSSKILQEGSPLTAHFTMFIPTLQSFGTAEQKAKWLWKAENCKILGSYVQTEIGHGTFVRGLETTATYDPAAKEFVLHSPAITAYKMWPGGLGQTVNYSVVMAQLYSLGKYHGLQSFMVQLRDEQTHKPMKGITIGENGHKVGFNTVNNGYLGFDNVRIPLMNMLSKNGKMLENGEFLKEKSSVLNYGIMTHHRVEIIRDLADYLAQAVTIATRYSTVRRQSPIEPNQPEPRIIEHVTQQMKLFPNIAKAIVFNFTADYLGEMHHQVTAEVENGNLSRLPELHALSCCLKAVCTNEVAEAVQICRLACGGHGYLNSSGFNNIHGCVVAAQHYEGDNTVVLLQTARFLLKSWAQALKGEKLTPTVEYLNRFVAGKGKALTWEPSTEGILKALQATAAGKVALAYKHLEARKKINSVEIATSQTSIELTAAAEIHCQAFLLLSAIEMAKSYTKLHKASKLNELIDNVLELYAVDVAVRSLGNLLQFVNISSDDVEKLQKRLEAALGKLKENAIGIVDAFDIPDSILKSTIGAHDGNVYERLLEAAKSSPLNQEDVNQSFHTHLKPFLKANL